MAESGTGVFGAGLVAGGLALNPALAGAGTGTGLPEPTPLFLLVQRTSYGIRSRPSGTLSKSSSGPKGILGSSAMRPKSSGVSCPT